MNISNSKLNEKKESKKEGKKNHSFRERKKSLEIIRRVSKVSATNKNERRRISVSSFITYDNKYSRMNNSQIDLNSEYNEDNINCKGIEQEIKYAILEMKNNCLLEIRRQSCDELELYKKKQLKGELNEDITNSQITTEELNGEPEGTKSKRKKYRKSKTNIGKNNNYKRRNLMKNKSNYRINTTGTNNESVDNSHILNHEFSYDKTNLSKSKTYSNKSSRRKERKSLLNEKFRFYGRGGVIEDSFNESETDEVEENGFLINPETTPFFIYDVIIFFAAFYSLIFIPHEITNECICYNFNKKLRFYINYCVDILFIIDVILNFFVEYYSKKDKLVKNHKKVINNYLRGWFFPDFLSALPLNMLYYYYCKYNPNRICITYEKNNPTYYLVMLKCLKTIKIFKMPANKKNQFISRLTEKASNNPYVIEKIDLGIELLLVIFGLHILSCIHIFIGRYTYPGWIFANNFQNFSLPNLYIISVYYLIQTMTTVGYGDISSDSFIEVIFRIILLAVGIICYSWLISNISNGINKQSYASMNFSNDCLLLENIRRDHADLSFKIYTDIKHYLEHKHFQRNIYNKNLLINSLPYTLKNNLIFSMFKTEIKRFTFFKGISNTNFISEILYNFSSVICKKNEIILSENEIIDEIIFVKDGRLSLELPIDMENPEISANEYLSEEFMNFAFNFYNDDFKFAESNINKHSITSLLEEERRESHIFHFKNEKYKNKKTEKEPILFYLRIFDVHKDEDYGGIYMFYGKRSPFRVKVRSKKAKLYTIKRDDFSTINDSYKNIIKRTQKKEKKSLKNVKNALIKTIDRFCKSNGIKIADEYKEIINKAIKDLNKNMLPDILKNTSVGKTIMNNELDEEINQTLKEFSKNIQLLRVTTIKNSKIDQQIIDQKRKTISNLMKESVSNLNHLTTNRQPKKSFNFIPRQFLGVGINAVQQSRRSYIEDVSLARHAPSLQRDSVKKFLNSKLQKTKKRYSEQTPEPIKKITTNIESDKSLKGIEFNYSESEKSSQTIKLKDEFNNSIDSFPRTISSLPIGLKNIIQNRIQNEIINQNKIKNKNRFQIEHICIEINHNNIFYNGNKNILNNINNNINSSINETNNTNYISNIRYNLSKSENKQNINNNSRNESPKNKRKNEMNMNRMKGKYHTYKKKRRESMLEQSLLKLTLSNKNSKYTGYINSPLSGKYFNRISLTHNFLPKNKFFNKNLSIDDNLSSTSAESFEIERSYKNLNQISKGRYIKDKKFQKKTIKFIKEYDKKKEKLKRIKTSLTATLNKQNIKNKEEDEQFKKIENTIKEVKTKMSDILIKKKKKKQLQEQLEKINSNKNLVNIKSYLSVSPTHKHMKKKVKKQLSLNSNEDNNNSTLRLNSFLMNPDETLGKLNCSNNEIQQLNIQEQKSGKSIFQLNSRRYLDVLKKK